MLANLFSNFVQQLGRRLFCWRIVAVPAHDAGHVAEIAELNVSFVGPGRKMSSIIQQIIEQKLPVFLFQFLFGRKCNLDGVALFRR